MAATAHCDESSEPDVSTVDGLNMHELFDRTQFRGMNLAQVEEQYRRISSLKKDDGVIDRDEFALALGLTSKNLIAKRLFDLFDKDRSGFSLSFFQIVSPRLTVFSRSLSTVDGDEFLVGLSFYCKTTSPEEKVQCMRFFIFYYFITLCLPSFQSYSKSSTWITLSTSTGVN
jgi:Ca2+-binding EF-hand superfamily protein